MEKKNEQQPSSSSLSPKPLTFAVSPSPSHSVTHPSLRRPTLPPVHEAFLAAKTHPPKHEAFLAAKTHLPEHEAFLTTKTHPLSGFVNKSAELKSKGVDTIACISVNDAFVMKAWKDNLKVKDEVLLLSGGNRNFTRAIRCELDLSDKPVDLEEGGAFTFSGAEDILKVL